VLPALVKYKDNYIKSYKYIFITFIQNFEQTKEKVHMVLTILYFNMYYNEIYNNF